MIAATVPNRRGLTARLHMLKKEQGLDEETYRDKLERLTGQRSAADLSEAELADAVRRFGLGRAGERASRLPATKQAKLVQALWLSLWNLGAVSDASDAAIQAFVRRQTGIDAAAWLTRPGDTLKVIEALKDWLTREGVEWQADRTEPDFMKLPAFRVALAQWAKLVAIGGAVQGRTWTGNPKRASEEVIKYAGAFEKQHGPMQLWSNAQWAGVTRVLGRRLRRKLAEKEKAA